MQRPGNFTHHKPTLKELLVDILQKKENSIQEALVRLKSKNIKMRIGDGE